MVAPMRAGKEIREEVLNHVVELLQGKKKKTVPISLLTCSSCLLSQSLRQLVVPLLGYFDQDTLWQSPFNQGTTGLFLGLPTDHQ